MSLENVLLSVRHLTHGDERNHAVRKVLEMLRRDSPNTTGERAAPVACNRSEHVMRYPRIWRGTHYAAFMRDKRLDPEVYHSIIQREGSKDIFSWTQHSSLDAAMKNAEAALTLLAGPSIATA